LNNFKSINNMKKILIFFCFFIITTPFLAQSSYFFNDTTGTVAKRITSLEASSYLSSSTQYVTISGYASGDLIFSIGDSLFNAKTSMTFGSGKAILIYNLWLPKYATAMIWFKSVTGSINVDIQTKVN